jgi:hypothetical protein
MSHKKAKASAGKGSVTVAHFSPHFDDVNSALKKLLQMKLKS